MPMSSTLCPRSGSFCHVITLFIQLNSHCIDNHFDVSASCDGYRQTFERSESTQRRDVRARRAGDARLRQLRVRRLCSRRRRRHRQESGCDRRKPDIGIVLQRLLGRADEQRPLAQVLPPRHCSALQVRKETFCSLQAELIKHCWCITAD